MKRKWLRRNINPDDKAALPQDIHLAPAWIGDNFHQLATMEK